MKIKLADFIASIEFDKAQLKASKKKYIIGIDEVGRGCIAGPMYAVASIINLNDIINSRLIYYVKKHEHIIFPTDSKKLNAYERSLIFQSLHRFVAFSGVGAVKASEIDEINDMTKSTTLCWTRALQNLFINMATTTRSDYPKTDAMFKEALILSDAFKINYRDIPCINITKGDTKSVSIAVASIIAKISRDMYMTNLHSANPKYNWISNKGYTEPKHIDAIIKNGATIYHRHTFSNVKAAINKKYEQDALNAK